MRECGDFVRIASEHRLRVICSLAAGITSLSATKASIMIGFIVFGLVVGALARLLLPGKQHMSILATLLIGVVGSVVGGVIANVLGTGNIWELNFLGSVVAVITAVVLIVVIDRASTSRS
jgi:uncharacterized membrane protein YeaQ/YmgE (transglycosylase-associated protein family)